MAVLLAGASGAFARSSCPVGRFTLTSDARARLGATLPAETIVLSDGRQVALEPVCPPVRFHRRPTPFGRSTVVARWPSCGAMPGRVVLRMTKRCGLLVGTVRIRSERLTVPFKVEPSRCGDFMLDKVTGEQCEPPGTQTCDDGCRVVTAPAP